MKKIEQYIFEKVAAGLLSPSKAKELLLEFYQHENTDKNDIAIIGIAGQFPRAKNTDEFWANLTAGRNCITPFPKNRRKFSEIYFKDKNFNEDIYKEQGYLDNIDLFDGTFFSLSPKRCIAMDPTQRLFLQTAWHCIEDAGYRADILKNTKTGVFVGILNDGAFLYREFGQYAKDPVGTLKAITPTRLSYHLNLTGPTMVIDTACSSGLVAMHQAIKSIKDGECEIAIVGSTGLDYLPLKKNLAFLETKSSLIKPFDKKADGTLWGEAVTAILIKPLNQAIKDKDSIYAVIKSSAINNDGRSNGITAPNGIAQEKMLKETWNKADINIEDICYIEAHGTGTALGDPIEVSALNNIFKQNTSKKQFCGIGSVKGNIGHTGGNSGLVSLIKTVLCIKNQTLPPSINCYEPNPHIHFENSALYVNDQNRQLPAEKDKYYGVTSLGLSGTNCHILLSDAPINKETKQNIHLKILKISALTQNSFHQLLKSYIHFLENNQKVNLTNFIYTANTGRGDYAHRLMIKYKDLAHLKKQLLHFLSAFNNELNYYNYQDIYFAYKKKITSNKTNIEEYEINDEQLANLNLQMSTWYENYTKETTKKNHIQQLAHLYTMGATINWEKIYPEKQNKVKLPLYPFDMKSYWLKPLNKA